MMSPLAAANRHTKAFPLPDGRRLANTCGRLRVSLRAGLITPTLGHGRLRILSAVSSSSDSLTSRPRPAHSGLLIDKLAISPPTMITLPRHPAKPTFVPKSDCRSSGTSACPDILRTDDGHTPGVVYVVIDRLLRVLPRMSTCGYRKEIFPRQRSTSCPLDLVSSMVIRRQAGSSMSDMSAISIFDYGHGEVNICRANPRPCAGRNRRRSSSLAR
jgi:hypothetical protein